ncbi:MAG: hypothetical protein LBV16_00615 [Elusimicrobiota bacterium]|jgi:hypothetical protein|nr:hypothetical protein [Elusimicrobiota bacterium]
MTQSQSAETLLDNLKKRGITTTTKANTPSGKPATPFCKRGITATSLNSPF